MDRWYQDWLSNYGEAVRKPYTEKQARAKFDAGKTIMMLIGEPDAVDIVVRIDLQGRLVNVTWLDALQRSTFSYLWSTEQNQDTDWPMNKLMIEQVHTLGYDHDQRLPEGEPTWGETYYISPDGRYVVYRGHVDGHDDQRIHGFDPDTLQIEDVPTFGAWDPLLPLDRGNGPYRPTGDIDL